MFGFRKKRRTVQVVYHDLAKSSQVDLRGTSYTFEWDLSATPRVGLWVWVPGSSGTTTGCVASIAGDGSNQYQLKTVAAVVSDRDMAQFVSVQAEAAKREAHELGIWLDMARRKVGLPVGRDLPSKPPSGLPPIPPTRGTAIGQPAYDRSRVWRRIYHRAVDLGRPSEETEQYELIADGWKSRGRKRKAD